VSEEWPDVSIIFFQAYKKTGGKIMAAGQLRDQGDIEKQHNVYQMLKQLRCSPSHIGDLMAMNPRLDLATLL
jgi:hypothetical protein